MWLACPSALAGEHVSTSLALLGKVVPRKIIKVLQVAAGNEPRRVDHHLLAGVLRAVGSDPGAALHQVLLELLHKFLLRFAELYLRRL